MKDTKRASVRRADRLELHDGDRVGAHRRQPGAELGHAHAPVAVTQARGAVTVALPGGTFSDANTPSPEVHFCARAGTVEVTDDVDEVEGVGPRCRRCRPSRPRDEAPRRRPPSRRSRAPSRPPRPWVVGRDRDSTAGMAPLVACRDADARGSL